MLPSRIHLVEVGPRDGLQNERTTIASADKVQFIEELVDAGATHVEVTSFVDPRWIRALADADEVARTFRRRPDVRYTGLIPNLRGYQRAREAGIDSVAVFMSATETHSRKNLNKGIEDALAAAAEILAEARREGLRTRAYLSVVLGCPYEGHVEPARVVDLTRRLLDLGAEQVSLGDTTGMGHPLQVRDLSERLLAHVSPETLALHCHDTRGTALANVLAGLEAGITTFDTSAGGLGGCPYAPGASGNLATEDLVACLHRMGVETGIDLDRMVEVSSRMQELLGKPLPGRVLQYELASRYRATASTT
jgi:hydroxymethylglutaryl-CoA lyase